MPPVPPAGRRQCVLGGDTLHTDRGRLGQLWRPCRAARTAQRGLSSSVTAMWSPTPPGDQVGCGSRPAGSARRGGPPADLWPPSNAPGWRGVPRRGKGPHSMRRHGAAPPPRQNRRALCAGQAWRAHEAQRGPGGSRQQRSTALPAACAPPAQGSTPAPAPGTHPPAPPAAGSRWCGGSRVPCRLKPPAEPAAGAASAELPVAIA